MKVNRPHQKRRQPHRRQMVVRPRLRPKPVNPLTQSLHKARHQAEKRWRVLLHRQPQRAPHLLPPHRPKPLPLLHHAYPPARLPQLPLKLQRQPRQKLRLPRPVRRPVKRHVDRKPPRARLPRGPLLQPHYDAPLVQLLKPPPPIRLQQVQVVVRRPNRVRLQLQLPRQVYPQQLLRKGRLPPRAKKFYLRVLLLVEKKHKNCVPVVRRPHKLPPKPQHLPRPRLLPLVRKQRRHLLQPLNQRPRKLLKPAEQQVAVKYLHPLPPVVKQIRQLRLQQPKQVRPVPTKATAQQKQSALPIGGAVPEPFHLKRQNTII